MLLRRMAVACATLLSLAALALGCEIYQRARNRWIDAQNPYVLRVQRLTPEFSEAFSASLWKEPWWEYVPGAELSTEVGGLPYRVSINSRGLRSAEVEVPKPPGRFRILCIGASTTVEGFTNESTYPALLERRLDEHYRTDAFEVVNCGISGLRAEGELAKLPVYLALEPDLLLEYNAVNDLCWGVLTELERHAPRWRWWFWGSAFLRRRLDRPFQPSSDKMAWLCRTSILRHLGELQRAARARGVEVFFASFLRPDPALLDGEERDFFEHDVRRRWGRHSASFASYCRLVDVYDAELERMCRELDAGLLRLQHGFRGDTREFVDVCHLMPAGIEKKAELVFRELLPLLEQRFAGRLPQGR